MENKLILRDTLALERTKMANQRTLLSYIRTGIYFSITGMGILKFGKIDWQTFLDWVGWGLIGLGILTAILGLFIYRRMAKEIRASYQV